LDKDTLDELAGGKAPRSLPSGFLRTSAVLTEYQSFRVRQWDQINKDSIRKQIAANTRKPKKSKQPSKKTSPHN